MAATLWGQAHAAVTLGYSNFEGCEPGQLKLSDAELQEVAPGLRAHFTDTALDGLREFCTGGRLCLSLDHETPLQLSNDETSGQQTLTSSSNGLSVDKLEGSGRGRGRGRAMRAAGVRGRGGASPAVVEDSGSEVGSAVSSVVSRVRSQAGGKRADDFPVLPAVPQVRPEVAALTGTSSAASSSSGSLGRKSQKGGKTTAVTSTSGTPLVNNLQKQAVQADLHLMEVREANSNEEKDAACKIHLSKNTFAEERQLVKIRIYEGVPWRMRTWLLVGPVLEVACDESAATSLTESNSSGVAVGRAKAKAKGKAGAKQTGQRNGKAAGENESALPQQMSYAAVTLRLNPYRRGGGGMWAQVLNMSVMRERHGLGTALMAGLEEVLRREEVDVLALYPAENGRAPAFWASIGFSARENSLLPVEELVPQEEGGCRRQWQPICTPAEVLASSKESRETLDSGPCCLNSILALINPCLAGRSALARLHRPTKRKKRQKRLMRPLGGPSARRARPLLATCRP
eukprot:TRINITY_DN58176_c0_g2_i3.p1 TRINITY_DN58176_c0_g2~~TRINITY_DN58176_c0_g2_i3.p1  ORF type:complete len:515 (-),score=104.12 TRINITY_DN58176_c0_g2_i3:417-1961(-)